MPGPPKFDPNDFGSSSSSTTTTPSAPSLTREQALAEVDKQVAKAKKKGNPNLAANLGAVADNLTPHEGGYDPLSVLSLIPAGVAALLTPDSYLVGDVGTGSYQKLGDMSLAQQLFGDHQLSLADPIKAAFTTTAEQRAYLEGNATSAQKAGFKLFEGAGLIGDVILDPINLIGGIGMTDDALKGLSEGTANLEKFAARASEAAASAAPDAPASRLVKAISEHSAAINDIDAQVAAGALDPAMAPALKVDAGKALMDQWHLLNGESLVAGDTTLSKLRYARDGLVHEAPFGARSRAAATTERLTDHAQSIAAYLGDGENFSSVAESDLFRNIPIYGGKSAAELTRDAWQKGYAALPAELRDSIGITGRIHRFNLEDLKSGRAFNPFAEAGSSTMPLRNPVPSPFSWIRGKAIEGEGMISMLRPSMGRTGKLWRAALEVTNGTEASIQSGVNRIRKEVGVGVLSESEAAAAAKAVDKGPVAAQLAKMTDEELAAYPFTLMAEARLDSLVRNAGKTMRKAAQESEREISGQLVRAEGSLDPDVADKYILAGISGDVRPTSTWNRLKQRALDAADNAVTGAGGQIKTRLAAAVDTAMRKADLPVDIERLAEGMPPSLISMKVFDHIVQDPEFGQEISKIAKEFSKHLDSHGLDEADLLRASMNAVSTAVAISKETGGVFHWVGAFADGKLAKELFSPQGAEALGRDAKLLHYSEQLGLAVADATYSEGATADVHALINDFVDQNLGVINDSSVSIERLLKTRSELTKGLRLQGLTEDKIAKIENDLANDVIDRRGLADSLYEAELQAAEVRGDILNTDDLLKAQRKAVRDAERTAQKLEEAHLAVLGYRDMDADLARMAADAQRAQQAVELVSVNMDPAISRLKQLSAEDPLADVYLPAEGAFRGGRTKASTLLNIGLGDAPVADAAGVALQRFNSFLGTARDLFGEGVDLERLVAHSAYTRDLTRGYDMTDGALNQATIARFFQENAHPDVTSVADRFGGWYQVLADNNEEAISEIRQAGRNVRDRRNRQLGRVAAPTSLGPSGMEQSYDDWIEVLNTELADIPSTDLEDAISNYAGWVRVKPPSDGAGIFMPSIPRDLLESLHRFGIPAEELKDRLRTLVTNRLLGRDSPLLSDLVTQVEAEFPVPLSEISDWARVPKGSSLADIVSLGGSSPSGYLFGQEAADLAQILTPKEYAAFSEGRSWMDTWLEDVALQEGFTDDAIADAVRISGVSEYQGLVEDFGLPAEELRRRVAILDQQGYFDLGAPVGGGRRVPRDQFGLGGEDMFRTQTTWEADMRAVLTEDEHAKLMAWVNAPEDAPGLSSGLYKFKPPEFGKGWVSPIPERLSTVGVSERDFVSFITGTFAKQTSKITPMLDALIDAMDSGDFASLEQLAVGADGGMEVLAQLQNGDFSYIQTLADKLFQSLDVGIGMVGGFGDPAKFDLMREVIRNEPATKASFDRMIEVMETFQNSSFYMSTLTETLDTHQVIMDEIGNLVKPMRQLRRAADGKEQLVNDLLAADLQGTTGALEITAEQRAALAHTLAGARGRVNSLRSDLTRMGRTSERLRAAHSERLKELDLLDLWIGRYEDLLDNQMAEAWDAALTIHQQTQLTKASPVMARLFAASNDYQALSRGVIDFMRDPQVAFKEVGGKMVRRTDDEILKLWKRKVDGAAKWMETFRDRAINGYVTAAGKEVGPFTRYDEARIVHERWLEDQFNQGFKHVWGGAALADKGGARAMIAMATSYPKSSTREATAAYDYLIDMLKAGYVGTAGFSNNNLLGATIENIRQGVSLFKSKDIWAADRGARTLDGIKSFAAANLSGSEYDAAMEVVSKAQRALEDKYGSDVLGAVLEARNQVGVTETSFFEEISGSGIEGIDESLKGMLKSWRAEVGDAYKLGNLEVEAKFGSSPALEKFAGVTSAIGQVPTHPARWYERKLAGKIERIASGNLGDLFSDKALSDELVRLSTAAEPYTARPGVEGLVRVDLYAQRRLAGDSIETAFNRVMASHFDYSDLSSFDRAMKRVMPFWTWRSRSIAHYYDMLTAKPSVLGHTLKIWDEQHRTQDSRAPYGSREAGNIFSADLGIQGRITDPSLDLIKTIDTTAQGIQKDGVLSGLFAPILDAAANDSAAPISLPTILASGYTAQGVTTDTPASIQKPLDWMADVPGGAAFVDLFAHRGKGGKWYWDHPSAAYAFSEALPMVDNVNRMIRPSVEEDDYIQKTLGTITQFLGTPVKPISEKQMTKNVITTRLQRKFDAAEQRKKARYGN